MEEEKEVTKLGEARLAPLNASMRLLKAREEYLRGGELVYLANKWGLSPGMLRSYSYRYGWREERRSILNKMKMTLRLVTFKSEEEEIREADKLLEQAIADDVRDEKAGFSARMRQEQDMLEIAARDLEVFEKAPLVEKLIILLELRIKNEKRITEVIELAIKGGEKIETLIRWMGKSKDSISELVKVIQLLQGEPTESVRLTQEEVDKRFATVRSLMKGRGEN